ncbi:hypothetical protein [Anaeromusa sp.]|uniref:hypothetical protein n=1 Tax=Anaeromusa sp. TaxID=1872520 RepID=UPI00260B502D|nr:hypothetical protein [Anaeromusa sp.]MDD3157311.1 hypothetical protein [Anaeromusa sp.]
MEEKNDLRKNGSGCKDMTAYDAIKGIGKENHHDQNLDVINPLLKGVKAMFAAAGFEVVGRIVLQEKLTGRKYR